MSKYKLLVFLSFLLISCENTNSNDTKDPINDLSLIKTIENTELNGTLELYSKDSLVIGYNHLFVRLIDTENNAIELNSVSFTPMMNMSEMGGMDHSAPHESFLKNEDGLYEGAAVFIMSGDWELSFAIKTDNSEQTVTFNSSVEASSNTKMFIVDSVKHFLTLADFNDPSVGKNEFKLLLHNRLSTMDFPAVKDLTIEIEPTMLSMNHGSPENQHPVHTDDGHYIGNVNFTMSGEWEIKVTVKSSVKTFFEDHFTVSVN